MKKYLGFNIWDDYDEYSKEFATTGYFEGAIVKDEIPDKVQKDLLSKIYAHLLTLDLSGVEFGVELEDNSIFFKHLKHNRLQKLIEELQSFDLKHKNIPVVFYSES